MPYSKENPPDPKLRKPRGKAKKTPYLAALKAMQLTEADVYKTVAKLAMDGDLPALKEMLQDLRPRSKIPAYDLEMPEGLQPHEQAFYISEEVEAGRLPADAGKLMVDVIAMACKVEEIDTLRARLEELEQKLGLK